MKKTRAQMISYLLLFCTTFEEHEAEAERLNTLPDKDLEAEYTAEYDAMHGISPKYPLFYDEIDPLTEQYL